MENNSKKRHYTVHVKPMDFSQKEIEAILEQHIPKENFLPKEFEEATQPTDGKCFKVSLLDTISHLSLFSKEREDEQQEWTRKIILKAFREALLEPEKYLDLYLLIPEKKWVYGDEECITVQEAIDFAEKVGGYTATWVEVALGWAQQITNGNGSDESWKAVCNDPDTLKWYRLVVWGNGYSKVVGGSSEKHDNSPASDANSDYYDSNNELRNTVPCVVLKKLHCPL